MSIVDEAVQAGARQFKACEVVGVSAETLRRWRKVGGGDDGRHGPKTAPPSKLSEIERRQIVAVATSSEFRDESPKQIVPTLADRGQYIASESSFYRVLHEEKLVTRRESSRAPAARPRALRATGPNQVYSWDITYLPGAIRGTFYYLYLFLDVWSRKIVGWSVESEESMKLAAELITQICLAEGIKPNTLTVHSDNGGPMKGSTMLATLQHLEIVPSFSRPHVSDDNPYSESLFRTLKYRPEYPSKPFQSLDQATTWVERFTTWYNHHHLHSSIHFVTPADRYAGLHHDVFARRNSVYLQARLRHPERWSGKSRDWTPTDVVFLNPRSNDLLKEALRDAA